MADSVRPYISRECETRKLVACRLFSCSHSQGESLLASLAKIVAAVP
jgi:hypothetical protein